MGADHGETAAQDTDHLHRLSRQHPRWTTNRYLTQIVTGEPDDRESHHVRFGGGPLEKALHHRDLASGLPDPKKNGKRRPLGLPTWTDKIVGEVVRLLLEAYYEPTFSDRAHGFRPGRGCHTALREIDNTWTGTAWFIEGDIADCFGSLDHEIMIKTLAEKIHDNRFLRLVRNMLTAGYLEDWRWGATLSGAPQGGVASPIPVLDLPAQTGPVRRDSPRPGVHPRSPSGS
jgi:hypothetical protein